MRNIKKTFLASLLSLSIFFIMGVALVSAQPTGPSVNIKLPNPFAGGGNSLFALLEKVINNILLPIGGVLAVLAFIYAGFLYVTAQGNEAKLQTAHKALLYTSVGTAVLLGSWVIAKVIENTINQLR
jgi:Type IV secretion system pilin